MPFIFMAMLLLKLKSSMEPPFWGDSALKRHRSISLLLAIPIEGSVTLKFAVAAVCWFFDAPSTGREMDLVGSGLVAPMSWAFSSVSTCSVVVALARQHFEKPYRSALYVLNRSSSAFTYPLLGPLFFRTSS